jgi:Ca2+-binding RTX toxin-like protein
MKVPFFLLFLMPVAAYSAIYQGTASDDVIQGGNESDELFLGNGADVGNGMSGADMVFGESGPDTLLGGEGNDIMVGGSANAIADNAANDFTGGLGNDLLMGGIYGDTYHYGQGDGFDCIRESGTMPGEVDKVVFAPGITRSSLEFSREKGDLFVSITGGDILRIESWFGMSDGGLRIEEFRFESDLTLYGADLAFDGVVWNGSAGADNYTAPVGGNYWMLGGAGSDVLVGESGMDVILGGAGGDSLSGRDGDDGLYGEADNDTLHGENGNDALYGGSGADTLNGNAGDDIIVGETGADYLYGGAGSDIYHWNPGDGNDTISDDSGATGLGAVNRLVFGAGILPSDVISQAVYPYHIKFVIHQNGVVSGWSQVNNWTYPTSGVQHKDAWRIEFADGTIWDGRTLGTALADTLNGTSGSDEFHGAAGGDVLSGNDGDDALYGEADNDTLNGGNGNDTLYGGSGNDTLNGNAGDDIIVGETGTDYLYGGAGSDIYHWNPGDGNDTISDDSGATGLGAINRLVFGAGILPSDVTSQAVYPYHIKFVIHQNGVVSGWAQVNNWTYSTSGVQHKDAWRIEFADGTIWDGRTLGTALADTLNGTSGSDEFHGAAGGDQLNGNDGDDALYGEADNDTLNGGNGNDTLYGGSGIDTLNGNAGDDIIIGETGTDYLYGGAGSDIYYWNPGDGDDVINDDYGSTGLGAVNRLVFGAGILPSDAISQVVPGYINHIKFMIHQNGVVSGSVTINYWNYPTSGVQHKDAWRIEFADGTIWDGRTLGTALADTLNGTSGNDEFHGAAGRDQLNGNDGNDALYGEADNDTLNGGNGNDTLYGGSGGDTLNGDAGDDIIVGGTGTDDLYGGAGSDVYYWNSGDGDDVINDDYGSTGLGAVNRLVFGAGILPTDVTTESVSSSAQHIKLVIRQNGVVSGSVTINYWNYYFSGVQHKDTWRIDFHNGERYYQNLLPTLADDTLSGSEESDNFHGYAGDDTLNGNGGDDVLAGGIGNDLLLGGTGSDAYRFDRGDGRDVITEIPETNSTNIVVLGGGILPSQVAAFRFNNSLVLVDRLSDSTLEITGWWPSGLAPIQKIVFSNGTEWTVEDLAVMVLLAGDVNMDGISDSVAYLIGNSISNLDIDGDGLANGVEMLLGLSPLMADSDGDGISDLHETGFGDGAATGPLIITIHTPSSAIITE